MKRQRKKVRALGDLGEFGLLKKICAKIPFAGDDCAVLPSADRTKFLLYTCDPVVENVHYTVGTPPRRVGWKVMARNLSDIAAMGGRPRWAVISLGLRNTTTVRWVQELYAGLQAVAKKFHCEIVGGDTTRVSRQQFIVVALIGEVEKSRVVLRSGARVGDSIFVTGRLGGSLRGKHLTFTPRINEARWLVRYFSIHAMIDLSDGLSSDLQRLREASPPGIGFEIHAAEIPLARAARGRLPAALNDGEDFELLFTIDPRHVTSLRRRWARAFPLELTEIGRVVRSRGAVSLIGLDGIARPLSPAGYDHFPKH
ncbi:MAG TPA: thiamine-phosphate kinase [Verrucomicrobiae bacterium]|nr:thiamine-phosphate kinase [Verrucomicrobiae bacterium]